MPYTGEYLEVNMVGVALVKPTPSSILGVPAPNEITSGGNANVIAPTE
jgi:hypothetical protein